MILGSYVTFKFVCLKFTLPVLIAHKVHASKCACEGSFHSDQFAETKSG
jgi:hypothetical protein